MKKLISYLTVGGLIVTAGDGSRTVAVSSMISSSPGCSSVSSVSADMGGRPVSGSPDKLRRQVLLIGDSMARCFPPADAVFLPVVRDDYQFDTIARDIVSGRIDIQYKFIVIWAGAHAIHVVNLGEVLLSSRHWLTLLRIGTQRLSCLYQPCYQNPGRIISLRAS